MARLGYGTWLRLFVARMEGDQASMDAVGRLAVDSPVTAAEWLELFKAAFMDQRVRPFDDVTTPHEGTQSAAQPSVGNEASTDAGDEALAETEEPGRGIGSQPAAGRRDQDEAKPQRYRTQGEA